MSTRYINAGFPALDASVAQWQGKEDILHFNSFTNMK